MFGCGVNGPDHPIAQILSNPDLVTLGNARLPELHLLIRRRLRLCKERVVFELTIYGTPDAVFEIHQRLGIGHSGITQVILCAGFGGGFALERPDHSVSPSSSEFTRSILASSCPSDLAGRIS